MSASRRHPRFDVRFVGHISANLLNANGKFRMITLGGGGCAFVGQTEIHDLIPPQKLAISIEVLEGSAPAVSRNITGNLIYVRPHNTTQEWLLGFSFGPQDQASLKPVMTQLEALALRGLIERA
jgi:hypothetical protein